MNNKLDIFFLFNLRKNLPNCFTDEERKTYKQNLAKLKRIVSNIHPFEQGAKVRCTANRFESNPDEDEIPTEKSPKKFRAAFKAIENLKNLMGYHDNGRTATIIGSYYELYGRASEFSNDLRLRDGLGRGFSSSENYVLGGYFGSLVNQLTEYVIKFDDTGSTCAWWEHKNLELV